MVGSLRGASTEPPCFTADDVSLRFLMISRDRSRLCERVARAVVSKERHTMQRVAADRNTSDFKDQTRLASDPQTRRETSPLAEENRRLSSVERDVMR